MTFTLFFSLGCSVAGFCITIVLTMASKRFLKGEIRKFVESMVFGTAFLYSFTFTQFLIEFLGMKIYIFELIKSIFLFIALIFLMFATAQIYEISEVLGFASKKTPEKLKKILKS